MLAKLTDDIKKKRLDFVVCYRLDRISRSVSDFSMLIEMMNRCNTGFICIREEFDTSKPMGKAMMYIASVFSQLERETIGERVRDNMLMLAKDGRWLGGSTPMGYDSVKTAYEAENGRVKYCCYLKENKSIEKIEKIFDTYIKYGNLKKTADKLNMYGLKTKTGGLFTSCAVKDIITNPVYCKADDEAFKYFSDNGMIICGEPSETGITAYNKGDKKNIILSVGKHRAAVSGSRWVTAQEMLESTDRYMQRSLLMGDSLASGAIICGLCGGRMYAVKRSGDRGFDYICENKRKKLGCRSKNLNGEKTDAMIREVLTENEIYIMKKEIRERLELKNINGELIIKNGIK